MARRSLLTGLVLCFVCCTSVRLVLGDDADASADTAGIVPGFESDKLKWSQVERIELTQGVVQQSGGRGRGKPSYIHGVSAYRFSGGKSRPLSLSTDPLAPLLVVDEKAIDHPAQLKERAAVWKERILNHNPAIRLDIVHRDSEIEMQGFLGGFSTHYRVHLQETIYTPPEELIQKARSADAEAVLEKTKGHAENKARATTWYYAANVLLGCVAAAVVGFFLVPYLRKRSSEQPTS